MNATDRITSTEELYLEFAERLQRWLLQASVEFPQFIFRITETRRTLQRQKYLYSIGRTRQPLGKVVTYTLDSMHRYGLAADIAIIRKASKQAVWDWPVWERVYLAVPPQKYGIERLRWEMPHLQIKDAEIMASQSDKYKLTIT